jgi:cation-transporting ATPase E
MLLSYLLIRRAGASVAEAQAMSSVIFAVIGLRVIAAIERPVRGWRLGLILAMAGIFALAFVLPFTRDFFALHLPGWRAIGATAGACIFSWFFVGLGWRIGRRLPFWREAAARVERAAADAASPGPRK